MNRIPLAWLSVCLVAICACSPQPKTAESGSLGDRIAGTWLATYEIDAPDSVPTAFIVTYHADGTATASSERAFGSGRPEQYGLSGTGHVQWEQTAPDEIRWRVLHFGYDANGTLTYISRTHGVRRFDAEFESSRGTFQVEVHSPEALLEPLDPNGTGAEPIATAEGSDLARRLRVRPPDGAE